MPATPFTGAVRVPTLILRRKHVVVHRNHHGNEDDRIVKKMQFDARENHLENAEWNRFAPKIVMSRGLPDQQKMLNVMPELNPESDHPPGMGNSSKSFAQEPKAGQHDQRITVMKGFRLDEPGIPQAKQAIGLRTRPSHDINLISLK